MISMFALCAVFGSTNATPSRPATSLTCGLTSMPGMTASAWYSSAFTAGGSTARASSSSMARNSLEARAARVSFPSG
jgi:hypothetical protein